jgi:hypothetical protein
MVLILFTQKASISQLNFTKKELSLRFPRWLDLKSVSVCVASNHVHLPLPPSRFQGVAPLASWRVAKAIIVTLIHPRLIDVDPMRRLGASDLG